MILHPKQLLTGYLAGYWYVVSNLKNLANSAKTKSLLKFLPVRYLMCYLAGPEADMYSVLLQQWTQNQSTGLL